MKFLAPFALIILLTSCGNDLPKKYNFGGATVEVIGEAWTPRGDSLLVRPKPCPWNPSALAVIKISGQSRENICLIFDKNETREAFYKGGSLPIRHEEFEWADGWPGKWQR